MATGPSLAAFHKKTFVIAEQDSLVGLIERKPREDE